MTRNDKVQARIDELVSASAAQAGVTIAGEALPSNIISEEQLFMQTEAVYRQRSTVPRPALARPLRDINAEIWGKAHDERGCGDRRLRLGLDGAQAGGDLRGALPGRGESPRLVSFIEGLSFIVAVEERGVPLLVAFVRWPTRGTPARRLASARCTSMAGIAV